MFRLQNLKIQTTRKSIKNTKNRLYAKDGEWRRVYNSMNILTATELYTYKRLNGKFYVTYILLLKKKKSRMTQPPKDDHCFHLGLDPVWMTE